MFRKIRDPRLVFTLVKRLKTPKHYLNVYRKVFAMEKLTPQQIADKVFELTEQFNRYVFNTPNVLDSIPDKATLVFLDADDPEFNRANLELARATSRPADGPVVYVRMQKHVRVVEQVEWEPKVLASPLAA